MESYLDMIHTAEKDFAPTFLKACRPYFLGRLPSIVTFGALMVCFAASGMSQDRQMTAPQQIQRTHQPFRKPLALEGLRESGTTLEQAQERAGRFLGEIIASGEAYEAVHALTYARITEDRELLSAIRQRAARADNSWGEQHVKLGAMHALIAMDQAKFPMEISDFLNSPDEGIRVRALMLARDSKDQSLISAVTVATNRESNPALKAVGIAALVSIEGSANAKSELHQLAKGNGPAAERAKIEVAHLEGNASPQPKSLGKVEEEKLKQLAISEQHDQRMFAIEELAAKGSEGSRGWLRGLGKKEAWRLRLTSAYFLLQSRDKKEAQRRLVGEEHPLVQVTLLATLRSKEVAE